MSFLGISAEHPKGFWIAGALIVIIIIITIIFKEWTHYFQSKKSNNFDGDDIQKSYKDNITSISFINQNEHHAIRTYALEELKNATKDFKVRVGVGATSDVYLAELGKNGDHQFAAVKRVTKERGGSKMMFFNEVSVLLRISHPNLVGLMGFCLEKGEQLLLLEYVPNKSLFHRLHTREGQSSTTLSWPNRLNIALDIAKALEYLHSIADPPVIHRDVKSSNILLINDDHAKLADFGLCKLGNNPQSAQTPTIVKGSFGYVDTYYLDTGFVSLKSDVYSFGVLLLELITGLRAIQGSVTLAEWTEECRKSGNLVGILDPKLNGDVNLEQLKVVINVANQALLANYEARPDMTQIVDIISSCIECETQLELPV